MAQLESMGKVPPAREGPISLPSKNAEYIRHAKTLLPIKNQRTFQEPTHDQDAQKVNDEKYWTEMNRAR